MIKYIINTDFNGIVIFEPYRLAEFFGGSISPGTDIFTIFRTSEIGDEVLKAGIVIPILAIDDAGYSIEVCINEESKRPYSQIVFTNGIFPLCVERRLVVADLAVFKEWEQEMGWVDIPIPLGNYAATIRGFQSRNEAGVILDCGYEIQLETVTNIPNLTGTTDINSRVLG